MDVSQRKKQRKKKIRLVILVVVLLFMPLAIAGVIIARNLTDNLREGTITAVTLSFGADQWEIKEKEEIRFFTQVVESGAAVDETATPREEYRHLGLVFHKLKTEVSYELLLSDSVNDCLYVEPDDGLYLIPAELAEKLLVNPRITGVALSFASSPVCTLSAGEESAVSGGAGEWTYTKADGTLTTLQPGGSGSVKAVLPAGEAIAFSFSLSPDFVSVRVLDEKGTLLYSGDPAELPVFSFEEDTDLTAIVSAEWFESSGTTYRGKIDYTFDVFYDIPTLCTLSQAEAPAGGVFEIRVEYASASSVAVTTTFSSGAVTQRREGKALVIRVPVSPEASPNVYSIVLLAADVDEEFSVTVLPPEV